MPIAKFLARWKRRDAENARRHGLPLERQLELLRADHDADVVLRSKRKATITSAAMEAVADRLFAFRVAALERKTSGRDGGVDARL